MVVCALLAVLLAVLELTGAQQAVFLSSTDADIVYNPPLCAPSVAGCASPWSVHISPHSLQLLTMTAGSS